MNEFFIVCAYYLPGDRYIWLELCYSAHHPINSWRSYGLRSCVCVYWFVFNGFPFAPFTFVSPRRYCERRQTASYMHIIRYMFITSEQGLLQVARIYCSIFPHPKPKPNYRSTHHCVHCICIRCWLPHRTSRSNRERLGMTTGREKKSNGNSRTMLFVLKCHFFPVCRREVWWHNETHTHTYNECLFVWFHSQMSLWTLCFFCLCLISEVFGCT